MLTTGVLYLFSFILIWQFVGYPCLMALVAYYKVPKIKNYEYQPFISIIVPAYNEEKYIVERINNLLELDYPKDKYEIIIVESGSTDNTYRAVEEIQINRKDSKPSLKFVREEQRKGMPSAINYGKNYAKGDIVLITGAHCRFEKNVLKEITPHFENKKVGAVDGRFIVSNPDNHLNSSASFYWDIEDIMRRGESIIDSACLCHGEINAFRKNLVDADTKIIAEDLDMPIRIRKKGYKIDYESNAVCYEASPPAIVDQIEQRKRNSVGTIQCIFKHFDYFILPKNIYSAVIFPSHKAIPMFSPFIFLGIPILYALTWDIKAIITHLSVTLITFSALLAALLYLQYKLQGNGKSKARMSLLSLPKIAYYVLLHEYLILLAWKDFILGDYSVLWRKVKIEGY